MAQPLMPKATAVWLVDNTALTFDQISDFCGLHSLEVQAIADGEVAPGMQGLDPTLNGQVTKEEITRCEGDPAARLEMSKPSVSLPKARQKGARYTPISKRQDRPDAIAWLLRTHPELSDAQISRLIGTTKPTINAVRDKTHRNTANITPQSPVYLGLCSGADLEKMVAVARARAGTTRAKDAGAEDTAAAPETPVAPEPVTAPAAPSAPEAEPSPWGDSPAPAAPAPVDETPSVDDVFGPKPTEPQSES